MGDICLNCFANNLVILSYGYNLYSFINYEYHLHFSSGFDNISYHNNTFIIIHRITHFIFYKINYSGRDCRDAFSIHAVALNPFTFFFSLFSKFFRLLSIFSHVTLYFCFSAPKSLSLLCSMVSLSVFSFCSYATNSVSNFLLKCISMLLTFFSNLSLYFCKSSFTI